MRTCILATVLIMAVGACSKSSDETAAHTAAHTTDTAAVDVPAADTAEPAGCRKLADGRCVVSTFQNPPVLKPNPQGVYELELGPVEFLIDGKRHCGRAYNGQFPGPTIDTPAAEAGKKRQVRVNLRNRFTKKSMQSLNAKGCTCKDSATGASCEPSHGGHGSTCACTDPDGKACHLFDFNVTNLHAHGSHVRPDFAKGGGCTETDGLSCRTCTGDTSTGTRECFFSDDVISRVEAGKGVQHRWDIDEDGTHHEGLNWYHPHIHGSTAIQVASGATGAWLVRGPLDALPGLKNAAERVFLISTPPVTYTPLPDGQKCDEDHITINGFYTLGDTAQKQTNLVNGLRQPRLVVPPGQIERWRFLHGSFLDEMTIAVFKGKDSDCKSLAFEDGPVALTQIGRDGITLPKPADGKDWPFAPGYLFLSPGYRIDTLLDGSKLKDGDTLCVMSSRFLQQDTTGKTEMGVGLLKAPTIDEIVQSLVKGDLITIVNVAASAGTATETQMPDLEAVAKLAPSLSLQGGAVDGLARCKEAQAVTDSTKIDQVTALWTIFYESNGTDFCSCPDHNINCKNFEKTDRSRYAYDRVLPVGAVEHWRLVSGFDGHPFHIHINPYLVCPLPPAGTDHPNTKGRLFEPPFAHWRDTYLVNLNRSVDVLTEYKTYTGAYVFHCHKLNHEDHGMMELIRVCDPKTESCDTLCDGGPCEWDACRPGDNDCLRAVTGARCMVDPSQCPEAALRCTPCKASAPVCPPESYCAAEASPDGQKRCLPGCLENAHCPATHACDKGSCVLKPCLPPCGPGKACNHGVCE